MQRLFQPSPRGSGQDRRDRVWGHSETGGNFLTRNFIGHRSYLSNLFCRELLNAPTRFVHRVLNVFGLSTGKQMRRTNAFRIVASVAKVLSFRYGTDCQLVCSPRSGYLYPGSSYHTVSPGRVLANPVPTICSRVLVDSRPEPVWKSSQQVGISNVPSLVANLSSGHAEQ